MNVAKKDRANGKPFMVVQSFPYTPVGGDAKIKVIGVGGGGGNALNRMIASGLQVTVNRAARDGMLVAYIWSHTARSVIPMHLIGVSPC